MDAEKWQKIASSFSYDAIQKAVQSTKEIQMSKSNQNSTPSIPALNNPTLELENHREVLLSTPKFRNQNPSTTPRDMHQAMTDMSSTILKLTKVVNEKSQVIQKQETIIEVLQRKLEAYRMGAETEDQISQPLCKNTNAIKGKRSDCDELKTAASDSQFPAGFSTLILNRLADLEKRMDQFTKSLPKKVQLCCEKYISSCKFKYDESGGLLMLSSPPQTSENKASWERSPRIKPKVNFSSQIRRKTSASQDKDSASVSVQSNTNCNEGVENYLKHLETIVNDLKLGFVQLLLKKVAGTRGNSNGCTCSVRDKTGGDLKLDKIYNALHNL